MRKFANRIIGLLIIIKTLIPPILLIIFLSLIFVFTRQTGRILTDSYQKVSENFVYLDVQMDLLKDEVLKFKDKVNEAKVSATKFTGEVKQAVRPISAALAGVQGVLKTILGGIAAVINEIAKGLKSVSFGAIKIKPIDLRALKNLNLVPINFPDLDLDFSINTASLEEISRVSQQTVADLEVALGELKTLFQFWGKVILVGFTLIFLWVFITLVGFFMRMGKALKVGWGLLLGKEEEHGLLYL